MASTPPQYDKTHDARLPIPIPKDEENKADETIDKNTSHLAKLQKQQQAIDYRYTSSTLLRILPRLVEGGGIQFGITGNVLA
jgi:hypothetical protein